MANNHSYGGGLNLDSIYGRKKPSEAAPEASAGPYVDESSSTGPYGGSQYASPYSKPAAKPTTEAYSESSGPPQAAPPAYGRPSSGYGEENAVDGGGYSSRPGYGQPPDHGGRQETSDYSRKPGYGGGEYETEGHSTVGGGYGRKPAASGYVENENFATRPPSQYESEYSAGGGDRRPHGRPESEYYESAPRPTGYGSAEQFEYGNAHEEEHRKPHYSAPPGDDYEGGRPRPTGYGRPGGYGRPDEDGRLASQTAGLSLGSDRHGGRRSEEYRPKRDDSDDSSGDEKKRHNKHKEKHGHHHKKHDDDDY